jgi:menaquinone-dependent protoporphyrinogen oxidase
LRRFLVGSAIVWVLLGAILITAERWFLWPAIPFAGWAVLLALYLRVVRPAAEMSDVGVASPGRACERGGRSEMTVLVAAASRHGATVEIAERIGADLAAGGLEVEVKKLADVEDVEAYEAVVLGSGVYLGNWLKDGRAFLDAHASELATRPTWLFASGSIVGDPPVGDDPNALRAGLAERLIEATRAREHKLFAGKLDRSKLGLLEKAAVRGAHASEGDHRDWNAVDEWAAQIASTLQR